MCQNSRWTIEHPATFYSTPDDSVKDNDLSAEEKKKALNNWEQDARQQITASSEGIIARVALALSSHYYRTTKLVSKLLSVSQTGKAPTWA